MSDPTRRPRAGLDRPPDRPLFWWLHRRSYLRVRAARTVQRVRRLVRRVPAAAGRRGSRGRRRLPGVPRWSGQPWLLTLNVVALAFVLLHAITWFNLAPKAIVVRLRGRRLPPEPVAAAHFAAWAVVSAIVAWIVLGADDGPDDVAGSRSRGCCSAPAEWRRRWWSRSCCCSSASCSRWAAAPPEHAYLLRCWAIRSSEARAARAVRAVAAALGPPVPLHPERGSAAPAAADAHQRAVLRRGRGRVGMGRGGPARLMRHPGAGSTRRRAGNRARATRIPATPRARAGRGGPAMAAVMIPFPAPHLDQRAAARAALGQRRGFDVGGEHV